MTFATLEVTAPAVSGITFGTISNTSAAFTATVTSLGNGTLADAGFCYSTSSFPTVSDKKLSCGKATSLAKTAIGLIPETGVLAEGIVSQTEQVLKNLGAVLAEAGLTYSDVIKTTVFLDNIDDFGTVNEIYAKYFTGDAPARSCVEVAALPKGALVEIEVVAAIK